MKKGYIYKIETPSGKIYIGQTNNYITRKRSYKNMKHKKQKYLWNDSLKYNYDPSDYMEIIEEILFEDNELDDREIYWIEFYKSYTHENNNGLNLTKGGRCSRGKIVSEETREKLRQANLGKKQSEETKLKKLNSLKETWKSEELRELKRQQTTDLIKKGVLKSNKGNKISDEHKEKIRQGNLGKKISKESIEKTKRSKDELKRIFEVFEIKELVKGNRWGKGYVIKGNKIGEWQNIHDTAKLLEVSPISISKCLRGLMLSASNKYVFEYKYI